MSGDDSTAGECSPQLNDRLQWLSWFYSDSAIRELCTKTFAEMWQVCIHFHICLKLCTPTGDELAHPMVQIVSVVEPSAATFHQGKRTTVDEPSASSVRVAAFLTLCCHRSGWSMLRMAYSGWARPGADPRCCQVRLVVAPRVGLQLCSVAASSAMAGAASVHLGCELSLPPFQPLVYMDVPDCP